MTSGANAWLIDQRWAKAYPLSETTTIGAYWLGKRVSM